jgi:hypothetical protein
VLYNRQPLSLAGPTSANGEHNAFTYAKCQTDSSSPSTGGRTGGGGGGDGGGGVGVPGLYHDQLPRIHASTASTCTHGGVKKGAGDDPRELPAPTKRGGGDGDGDGIGGGGVGGGGDGDGDGDGG